MATFPRDDNRQIVPGVPPAATVLEETYDATISASTEITLNASTTWIEVTAIDKPIFLKWGTDNAASTDFDAVISQNTSRMFKVPPSITAVNFIEEAATAKLAVTEYQ